MKEHKERQVDLSVSGQIHLQKNMKISTLTYSYNFFNVHAISFNLKIKLKVLS